MANVPNKKHPEKAETPVHSYKRKQSRHRGSSQIADATMVHDESTGSFLMPT